MASFETDLGDGLHAGYENDQVRLWTDRGDWNIQQVCLDRAALIRFFEFIQKTHDVTIKITKNTSQSK